MVKNIAHNERSLKNIFYLCNVGGKIPTKSN